CDHPTQHHRCRRVRKRAGAHRGGRSERHHVRHDKDRRDRHAAVFSEGHVGTIDADVARLGYNPFRRNLTMAPGGMGGDQGGDPRAAMMARYRRGGGGMPPQGAMPPGGPQQIGGPPMPAGGGMGMAGPQPGMPEQPGGAPQMGQQPGAAPPRMPAPWAQPAPQPQGPGGSTPRPMYQGAPGPGQRTQMSGPQQPGAPQSVQPKEQQDQQTF